MKRSRGYSLIRVSWGRAASQDMGFGDFVLNSWVSILTWYGFGLNVFKSEFEGPGGSSPPKDILSVPGEETLLKFRSRHFFGRRLV